jgi:uncharacterized protein
MKKLTLGLAAASLCTFTPLSAFAGPLEDGFAAYEAENYTLAIKLFRTAAANESTGAYLNLGIFYEDGIGVEKSDVQAFQWYQKSANAGDKVGQYKLGVFYMLGRGTGKSVEKSSTWLIKAADQGQIRAQYLVGLMHYHGEGAVQSFDEAAKWFRKSADQGEAEAQYMLGLCYYDGDGVIQDYVSAGSWWRKAADQGDAKAQYRLGMLHKKGEGVKIDRGKASYWLKKAEKQGNTMALAELSGLYTDAINDGMIINDNPDRAPVNSSTNKPPTIPTPPSFAQGEMAYNARDYDKAFLIYTELAKAGNPDAQNALGSLYSDGKGTTQSREQAIHWWQKARKQGHAEANINVIVAYASGWGNAAQTKNATIVLKRNAKRGDPKAKAALKQLNIQ